MLLIVYGFWTGPLLVYVNVPAVEIKMLPEFFPNILSITPTLTSAFVIWSKSTISKSLPITPFCIITRLFVIA